MQIIVSHKTTWLPTPLPKTSLQIHSPEKDHQGSGMIKFHRGLQATDQFSILFNGTYLPYPNSATTHNKTAKIHIIQALK